ncbi:MAG: hypothetical protein HC763_18085 [Hydrococcus sp. CRU_1_1]|nr:hypothetical protein [Hydrococcus sp. CRU_1_1]
MIKSSLNSQTSKPAQKQPIIRLNSIGTRLFVYVLGSAAIGLAVLSYLFYQNLVKRAEAEIQSTLSTQIKTVEAQLTPVEQQVRSLSGTINLLQKQGVQTTSAYEQLAFSELRQGSKLLTGIGFGQASKALVTEREWFFPYYFFDKKVAGQPGQRLPPPNDDIVYVELFADENYPKQTHYTIPAKSSKAFWLEPYGSFGDLISTYATPVFDRQKKLIAVINADIDLSEVTEQIAEAKVLQDEGYFAIISAQGRVVAYPPAPLPPPENNKPGVSVDTVPELKTVWSLLQKKLANKPSEIFTLEGKYWAYQKVPSTEWVMLAAVPQATILTPVILTSVSAILGLAILLGIVILLFVRNLNSRLQPILDECNQLAATDAQTQAELQKQDEIGQLSTSFFNLLTQLEANQEQIRQEANMRLQLQEEQRQTVEAESQVLQDDIGQLLDVVSAVEDGNLTVQAPVTDRVTGLVADTFNRLTEELAKVLGQVVGASRQVFQSASNLEEIATAVATNVDRQGQEVTQVLTLSEQVEHSAQNVTQQLQRSIQALLDLSATVLDGQTAMTELTQGTETLRQGSDRIVQQMKTLGEFVGLAEQFVQDQSQIASQTQVLALNASLVAARAAEQQNPRQFAVAAKEFEAIADQVSKLAQLTNDGLSLLEQRTTQIQNVVSMVDAEVQNLGGLVGGFTQGVEQSTQVFNNVRSVTTDAVRSGEAVAQSNQDIISSVQSTATAMRGIADIAQRTAKLTQDARSQSEVMGKLSTQLLERVEFFRLPAEVLERQEPVNLAQAQESTIDVAIAK